MKIRVNSGGFQITFQMESEQFQGVLRLFSGGIQTSESETHQNVFRV